MSAPFGRRAFFAALLTLAACRRAWQVGDHVLVDWKGNDTPAVIVAIEGPAKFRVHYDGYGEDWDETVPGTRIRARLSGPITAPVPGKLKSGASPSASAAPSVYRAGDRVRVEWHGSIYPATVIAVLGAERYRVHYDNYGPEWDETVGLNRIQRR